FVVNNDVPVMAASAKSILFGDFSKYLIRDVLGFQILRLEERYAEFLQIGFLGFPRHDGALIDAGTKPIQFYQNSAS
ncbi:MAG: phage major capsid protein, partial [Phycisphaeraceae bacterium]|nr:phage major capsid protein [Phycisphaeraceae bacterium]